MQRHTVAIFVATGDILSHSVGYLARTLWISFCQWIK